MHIFRSLAIGLAAYAGYASSSPSDSAVLAAAARRALPNAPNGYTPALVECPPGNRPTVRSASTLSPNETSWVQKRRNNTIDPMKNLLTRLNITAFDAASYIQDDSKNASALPNIGIAISGGGYRALQNGAGALKAFDDRTENSTNTGQMGGLLQSATYLTGLSGGAWLVGSLFMNNFSTVGALQAETSGSVWEFGNSLLKGPAKGGIQLLDTAHYYSQLSDDVDGKQSAGFNITLTDYWGRALSFQLINATNGGPAYTWSSIALTPDFQNADTPFPVVVADSRAPGQVVISSNATIYEFSPFEFGTWDPTAFGFVPTQYLGSNFSAGNIPANESCVVGFDNGGFVMGTSSSLFNTIILAANGSSLPSPIQDIVNKLVNAAGLDNEDIADYTPNPFYHYNNNTNPAASNNTLSLVDGGEDLQNLPLHPLIQPVRAVDVIFAVDSSADTDNWPNATALVATYQRSLDSQSIANGTAFPSIPDQNTIVNLGLNTRPTFFGCNASNSTSSSGHPAPLIVYIPNAPYTAFSNASTFNSSYTNAQRDAIVANGYNVATMANGTVDAQWPMCAGCAILSRSLDRTGTRVPDACAKCFQKFCWDGTVNSTKPAQYAPSLAVANTTTTSSNTSTKKSGTGASARLPATSWTASAALLGAFLLAQSGGFLVVVVVGRAGDQHHV